MTDMSDTRAGEITQVVEPSLRATKDIETVWGIFQRRSGRDVLVRSQQIRISAASPIQVVNRSSFVSSDHIEHGFEESKIRQNCRIARLRAKGRRPCIAKLA